MNEPTNNNDCDIAIDRMHAELDGVLEAAERALLEAHVEACPSCRTLREQLADLIVEARQLPKELAPSRDLWPAISARLTPREQQRSGTWSPRRWRAPAFMALALAAAALLVWSLSWSSRDPVSLDEPFVAQTQQMQQGIAELEAVLAARSHEMDPETLEIVRQNLAIIDAAIEETRVALERDGQSEVSQAALVALQQHKIHLLRKITDLAQAG